MRRQIEEWRKARRRQGVEEREGVKIGKSERPEIRGGFKQD